MIEMYVPFAIILLIAVLIGTAMVLMIIEHRRIDREQQDSLESIDNICHALDKLAEEDIAVPPQNSD